MKAKQYKNLLRSVNSNLILVQEESGMYCIRLYTGIDPYTGFDEWMTVDSSPNKEEIKELYKIWRRAYILCHARGIYPVQKILC